MHSGLWICSGGINAVTHSARILYILVNRVVDLARFFCLLQLVVLGAFQRAVGDKIVLCSRSLCWTPQVATGSTELFNHGHLI